MGKYLIRGTDGQTVEREPTVGKWYCGMVQDDQYAEQGINGGFRDEMLAEYHEGGEFYDDSEIGSDPVDMGGYDFLQEQM
jgi:hypothetical protein